MFKKRHVNMLRVSCTALVFAILASCHSSASMNGRLVTGIGVSFITESVTIPLAKEEALDFAKKNIIEQAGYYIRVYSKSKNAVIEDDEVIAVSNKITHMIDVKYEIISRPSEEQYVKVVAQAEVDDEYLESMRRSDIEACLNEYNALQKGLEQKNKEKHGFDNKLMAVESYETGNSFFERGEYFSAIKSYKDAISSYSDFYELYVALGRALSKVGDFSEAISMYDKAISMNSKYLMAYQGKGNAYFEMGDYTKALVNYNIVLTLNKDYAHGYILRGKVYEKLGNKKLAEKDFMKADNLQNVVNGG